MSSRSQTRCANRFKDAYLGIILWRHTPSVVVITLISAIVLPLWCSYHAHQWHHVATVLVIMLISAVMLPLW